jgi:molecular chaperone DnaJ
VQASSTITVRVPAGVDDGMRLRVSGEGEASADGGPAGDLYVVLQVAPHPVFRREGAQLHCEAPITFAQAALGTVVRVPLVGGGEEELDVEAGTQSGTVLRLRGKGFPALDRNGRGDLHVTIRVETPRRISTEQRELLEKLAELDGKETAERGIFERVKDIFN